MKTTRWINNFILAIIHNHILSYPTPKNLSYSWSFGSLSGLCLVLQILTGLFLSMHYVADITYAFASIEHIMRDVNYGWLVRYMHANGASMFFLAIFFHIFRGLYYGSYAKPRVLLWLSGIAIFLLLMAIAFMGYVLPWGQMSFWGATVITNLFSAIPIYGTSIVEWLWGGFSVASPTLNRFYSLHYLLPFVIAVLSAYHLYILHKPTASNPLGIKTEKVDKIPFYPYFIVKDLFSYVLVLIPFLTFVFFFPELLSHSDNYIKANPLVTPPHIVPEWYFLSFYSILKCIKHKYSGLIGLLVYLLFHSLNLENSLNIYHNYFFCLYFLSFYLLIFIGSYMPYSLFILYCLLLLIIIKL